MILLSLGTHEQPFSRALRVVAPLGVEETVLVQHGYTAPDSTLDNLEWTEFLALAELRQAMTRASVAVVHGGVGSILLALQAGRIPVVLPRLARFGEHVDDHQVEIARRFATRGLVVPVLPGDDVHEAMRTAKASAGTTIGVGRELEQALADEVRVGAGPRRRARRRRGARSRRRS